MEISQTTKEKVTTVISTQCDFCEKVIDEACPDTWHYMEVWTKGQSINGLINSSYDVCSAECYAKHFISIVNLNCTHLKECSIDSIEGEFLNVMYKFYTRALLLEMGINNG